MKSPRLAKLALVAMGILVACLFLELGLRVKVLLEDRGLLESSIDPGIEIPEDRRATLVHMIRFSSERKIVCELKPDLP